MNKKEKQKKIKKLFKIKTLKRIHTGSKWTEGPCYLKKKNIIIWSDIPNNRILQYNLKNTKIFRYPSNFSNGNTTDINDNVFTCEHGGRRITKTNNKEKISLVIDKYKNKRLNSPNDICIHSNGTIFFTDPPYGLSNFNNKRIEGYPGKKEYGGCFVFKFDPKKKKLSAIIKNLDKPNGVALSADEKKIYITNSGKKRFIVEYALNKNLSLKNSRIFATTNKKKTFDGIRVDKNNNIWASCGKGIKCFAPNGLVIDYLKIPETVSNLEFGGKKGNILFITATTSLYQINLNTCGAKFK